MRPSRVETEALVGAECISSSQHVSGTVNHIVEVREHRVGCRKSANRNPIAENRLQPMPSSLAGCLMHCTSSSLLPPVG